MFFIYFILICIAIGLINWFIVFPLLEKETTKKILEVIKNVLNVIANIVAVLFAFYVYFATIIMTTNILYEYTKIEQIGILAFILVTALAVLTIKKFKEDK